MSTVSNVTQNTTTTERTSKDQGEMGKDDFMKLLVTQLRYQDPMKPMEDKEFIAQMAQFSALEQMQNLNTYFLSTQALSMIGKNVSWSDDQGAIHSGVVKAVHMASGTATLSIGDALVEMDKVVSVQDATEEA